MTRRRLGAAAMLVAGVAGAGSASAASFVVERPAQTPEAPAREPRPEADIIESLREEVETADGLGRAETRPVTGQVDRRTSGQASRQASRQASGQASGQGPVLARPGDWAHAEASVVIGSQLVNQDLGSSTNIFQTVSAEAEDVSFGQHVGARGSFFVNRYLGAEAGFARTRTEFEFLVADDEAGVTSLDEALVQVSQEASIAAVAQWPRAAVTPYVLAGYAWRTAEVEGADPFESGAVVFGVGIKVPFPTIPVSLAFDYRFIEYRDEAEDALRLAEGGVGSPQVSALTLGVVVRLNVNR